MNIKIVNKNISEVSAEVFVEFLTKDDLDAHKDAKILKQAGFKAEQGGQVWPGTRRDPGNGRTQGPGINPADHPRPTLAHQTTGPRVDTAGNRELRDHFTKNQTHQQLPGSDQQIGPEHRRAAGGQTQAEQGVDADDGRQVGKAQGKVFPQAHASIEIRAVAEGAKLFGILIGTDACTRGR